MTAMSTGRANAADNLMLTGTVLFCPDCADDRIFVEPDCGDGREDCGDYCCTDCGAAVSLPVVALSGRAGSARAA
jgi:predicted RNA-binding Zn-ribbon protein involved in translation (DUF1610 family)